MPFNPNIPGDADPVIAPPLREQFNSLKALIDALTLQVNGQQALITVMQSAITSLNTTVAELAQIVPIGAVLPWCKNSFNVPLVLPENFLECNGQVVNDAASPLNGETLPDLNGQQRFLRGAAMSGDTGGAAAHSHEVAMGAGYDGVNVDSGGSGQALDANPKVTSDASSLPPFYEVVMVMRVK